MHLKSRSKLWFRIHFTCNLVWLWSPSLKYCSWWDNKSGLRFIYVVLKQGKQSHRVSAGKWNPHHSETPAGLGLGHLGWGGGWSTPPSLNLVWFSVLHLWPWVFPSPEVALSVYQFLFYICFPLLEYKWTIAFLSLRRKIPLDLESHSCYSSCSLAQLQNSSVVIHPPPTAVSSKPSPVVWLCIDWPCLPLLVSILPSTPLLTALSHPAVLSFCPSTTLCLSYQDLFVSGWTCLFIVCLSLSRMKD